MPRYAIISDIHSNLEALHAVIQDMREVHVDRVICLGDLIGYGADPQPCIQMVRNLLATYGGTPMVIGNHDHAIAHGLFDGASGLARVSMEWTAKRLTGEQIEWLRQCPFVLKEEDSTFVHASPYYPQAWHYIVHPEQAEAQFTFFKSKICFIGHTHRPFIYAQGDAKLHERYRHFVDGSVRYLVNVGSVGQSRDGNPQASYTVYDTESGLVDVRRIPYDAVSAAAKMRAARLPENLAARLVTGT